MSRRTGTPSLEASQQQHISELVLRVRTLEHANKKLQHDLDLERSRAKEAMNDMQALWHEEMAEMFDVLQTCHRLAELRTIGALEQERTNVLREQDITRKEKVARVQRDFQITMFQILESELDARIEELVEEKEELERNYGRKMDRIKTRLGDYASQVEDLEIKVAETEEERDDLQDQLVQLRQKQLHNQASSDTTATQLERTTLQLDGANAKNAELLRTNDELKQAHADLLRQLSKWQNLETKGGAEVETLRKQRIELEVEVSSLKGKLEKRDELLEKRKKEIAALKDLVDDWSARAGDDQVTINIAHKELNKAQKQIERLKNALETERARVKPRSPQKADSPPEEDELPSVEEESKSDSETSPLFSPPLETAEDQKTGRKPKSKPKPQAASKPAKAGPSGTRHNDGDEEVEEVQEVSKPPSRRNAAKVKVTPPLVSDEEEVTEAPKRGRPKGKGKGKEKAREPSTEVPDPQLPKKRQARGKEKQKESESVESGDEPQELSQNQDEEVQILGPIRKKTRKKAPPLESKGDPPGQSRSKRARSATAEVVDLVKDDEPPKKKSRRINIFPNPNAGDSKQGSVVPRPFTFSSAVFGGNLDIIPNTLTPVRPDRAPARSNSALLSRLTSGYRKG